jgi:CelD/BcsL family acetyltransferase involved in cellulose biosynthesis
MAHLEIDPLRYSGFLAGAEPARRPQPLAGEPQSLAMQVGDLVVELRSLAACRSIVQPWRALAEAAIEPNVFFEPDIILAAQQHLPEAAGHAAVLVWDPRGLVGPRLLAFWPMLRPRRRMGSRIAKGFAFRYGGCGAPLLDRQLAVEAACALIVGLKNLPLPPAAALFNQIPLEGPAARALRAAAALSGLQSHELGVHARACLWKDAGAPQTMSRSLARDARRLSAHGDLTLVTARRPEDVRDLMEVFLALEASGWKGRRGTAILTQTRDCAYVRMLTRALSQNGQVAVHVLQAGCGVVAAGLVLASGGQRWFLKIAHDEALQPCSPGALLSDAVGRMLYEDEAASFIDSCAVPGHAMIERVWKGRVRIGDLVLGLDARAPSALRHEQWRRRARSALRALRGRFSR